MKKYLYTLAVVLSLSLLSASSFAQSSSQNVNAKFTDIGISNLKNGIKSENMGIKKSSIYLSGKYKLHELEDTLIEELKSQENADIKLLIAKVLHQMYSEKGMIALEDFARDTTDKRLQKFSNLFINDYNFNKQNVAQN